MTKRETYEPTPEAIAAEAAAIRAKNDALKRRENSRQQLEPYEPKCYPEHIFVQVPQEFTR